MMITIAIFVTYIDNTNGATVRIHISHFPFIYINRGPKSTPPCLLSITTTHFCHEMPLMSRNTSTG